MRYDKRIIGSWLYLGVALQLLGAPVFAGPSNSVRTPANTAAIHAPGAASGVAQTAADSPILTHEGQLFRLFVRDLVAASGETTATTADDVRGVLARHPQVLEWVLEGKDLRQIAMQADLGELDLTALSRLQRLSDYFKNGSAPQGVTTKLRNSSVEARISFLKSLPDSEFLKIADEVQGKVAALELHKTQAVMTLTHPQSDLGVSDRKLAIFLEDALPKYFSELGREDKFRLVLAQLDLPPFSGDSAQMTALLQSSGPCLQKLFQLVGRDVKNPKYASAMASLQSDIRPFSGKIARTLIETRIGRPIEEVFSEFSEIPMAAASVGQVHRARLKGSDQQVVVKIRRPGIDVLAKREAEGLLAATRDPALLEMLKKIQVTLTAELDFRNEAQNLDLGEVYHVADRGIDIARRAREFTPEVDVLVTHLAPGSKISLQGGTAERLALRGRAVYDLLERWFEEVIFDSGFFHGDLHPGNIFFMEDPAAPQGYRMTLIDFGNAATLNFNERRAFLQMVLACGSSSPGRVLSVLDDLGKISPEAKHRLAAVFEDIFEKHAGVDSRIDHVLVAALDHGMEIPSGFVSFNRGRLFLEKELASINTELEALDPQGKAERFFPKKIYQKTAVRRITRSFFTSIFGGKSTAAPLVTTQMLIDALADKISATGKAIHRGCSQLFGALFNEAL